MKCMLCCDKAVIIDTQHCLILKVIDVSRLLRVIVMIGQNFTNCSVVINDCLKMRKTYEQLRQVSGHLSRVLFNIRLS